MGTGHPGAVGPGTAARFKLAAAVTRELADSARAAMRAHAARLDGLLGDSVLLLPSAASAAPSPTAPDTELDRVRAATIRLCCIAGLTGRPALSIPLMTVPGPFGRGGAGRTLPGRPARQRRRAHRARPTPRGPARLTPA